MADLRRKAALAPAVRLRVTCACGTSISVPAGTPATCSCGASWDTTSIPVSDLDGVASSLRRLRRRQAGFALSVLLAVAVLALLRSSAPALALVAAFGFVWWRLCKPWWQARRTPVVVGAPTWTLASRGTVAPEATATDRAAS